MEKYSSCISNRHGVQVNYATEFSRSWMVIGRIVMRLNAPDFVGVESLG